MSFDLAQMAALHAQCFTVPRPWSAAEFASLLAGPGVIDLSQPQGFLIGRVIADEAELLTLAVALEARRQGTGNALTRDFLSAARAKGATQAFLEVAADNAGAIALYKDLGFTQTGLRKGYYGGKDALVMARSLSAEKTD